ncbi:hypothetical protein BTW15_28015 [Pseudomonas syringae pv. tomato]|uniref:Uncharacterized protein n=3 Tax=Pseudomonas syringae group TaxID=136849 RepID=A0A3M3RGA3_9PSED|nr:hypothetical protein XJ28_08275 [Pseudomonas syringae pv. tomato]EEB57281.1 hypothetical protein PSPTOT1_0817 [Pseudomonas syringae pv. tomato T1]QBI64564.1 hypothetical protein EIZ61_25545 [Pseudomonas syringae]RMN48682.1 hypothetical protein ALQ58_05116 [Pseudomonas syringae pv. apii]RMO88588.1 hypothetical protein ALQ32_04417 [Pseudomonas syringae pv. tagetis]
MGASLLLTGSTTSLAALRPPLLLGSLAGGALIKKLSREAFVRLVTWLVLVSGLALIVRYLTA